MSEVPCVVAITTAAAITTATTTTITNNDAITTATAKPQQTEHFTAALQSRACLTLRTQAPTPHCHHQRKNVSLGTQLSDRQLAFSVGGT